MLKEAHASRETNSRTKKSLECTKKQIPWDGYLDYIIGMRRAQDTDIVLN